MKTGSKLIIIGCIAIIMGLPSFYFGELLPYITPVIAGILLIIHGIFKNRGYHNKNFYMLNFSVITIWGLILLYIFLFRTNEYLEYMAIFYILTGLFILTMINYCIAYIRRNKKIDYEQDNE